MIIADARRYLLTSLAAAPVVLDRLLRDATSDDWDRRPDPERFTLREALSHLADWETIWHDRVEAMRDQERPTLPGYDPDEWAAEHDYTHRDPLGQADLFRARRAHLHTLMAALSDAEWAHTGRHTEWGILTIADIAAIIAGHDAYHLRQVAEWLNAGEAG